jgi:DNA adenine methylase
MRPAFPWPGGESLASKYIIPHIPPHTCYCERFAGGIAVLLAKEPSKVEVINDINADLVNFYRCVRFHPDELIKEIQWRLASRREFVDLKAQRGLTDIQRAASWFLIQGMSFGGDGNS